MALLEVKNIYKNFGSVHVLKDISFSLEKGQSISIIGSSGSGKTTLLRCLNFLETPDRGKIIVNNEVLFDGEEKKKNQKSRDTEEDLRKKRLHFGLVFQNFNLFPQYTALENVILAPKLINGVKDNAEIQALKDRGMTLLTEMGLADRANHYPHQLSGGQQQRVAIARALAMSPDILCFDEPTSALDPELTGEVLKVIRKLAEEHTTMIIVTHEMAFARDVADTAIFMDDGMIIEEGSAKEVIDHPKKERTKQFLANYSGN